MREAERGHLGLAQREPTSAINQCRRAALGGHALRRDGGGQDDVTHNACRYRRCPKRWSSAAKRRLDARQADLLPVGHYPVVFTLPAHTADTETLYKAVPCGLLFDIAIETPLRNAVISKRLSASIGATLELHTEIRR